eukprot:2981656-Pyramimonas_sp.AAC.1
MSATTGGLISVKSVEVVNLVRLGPSGERGLWQGRALERQRAHEPLDQELERPQDAPYGLESHQGLPGPPPPLSQRQYLARTCAGPAGSKVGHGAQEPAPDREDEIYDQIPARDPLHEACPCAYDSVPDIVCSSDSS